MDDRKYPQGHIATVFIWFGLTSIVAIILLLIALIVWMSELTGSIIIATLILGGFFGILASMIYMLSLRTAIEQIREQIGTVYEVAHTAKEGYEWLIEKFYMFMHLRDK